MRIEFSRSVEPDLEAIGDYIAQDNPTRAVSFVRELRSKLLSIGENPLMYQLRPETVAAGDSCGRRSGKMLVWLRSGGM